MFGLAAARVHPVESRPMKIFAAILVLTPSLAGCASGPRVVPHRPTLTVLTPEGPKVGSSVVDRDVQAHDGFLRIGDACSPA